MMNASAILIGVRKVDPSKYDGWSDPLDHPENDVETMRQILIDRGFSTRQN
ncbi:MAG: hypothetical protein P0116_16935 [Candidatus Nitrosocosmicus sp.]|nr:hypothetical protein [Candidatus Nitrosocosmicus sp.]